MSSFSRKPREGIGAIIGIAGATGTGKTLSGLRVARGLCAGPDDDLADPDTLDRIDARIAFIDTERRRALHYQVADGEKPQPFRAGRAACFRFSHADLGAPFTPDAYRQLIAEADEAKFGAIVIDSFSHEWDGDGGCHDMHYENQVRDTEEAKRRAMKRNNGSLPSWWSDAEQMDKQSIGAWREPKMLHKKLVSRLLQCGAHVIVCMRAEDKLRIDTEKETKTKRNGDEYEVTRTKITAPKDMPPGERWAPVCEKRFPYELLTSFVMTPDAPGVPIPLKMHEDHRGFLRDGAKLDEEFGRKLAAWARGASPPARSTPVRQPSPLKDGGDGADANSSPPGIGADTSADDFPGDRQAPPPDGADVIWLGARWFDPAEPALIPCAKEQEQGAWKQWASALRRLLEAAPTSNLAREWQERNARGLLWLKAVSPALHGWTLENAPPVISSDDSGEYYGKTA